MPSLNKAVTRDSLITGLIATKYLTNGCNYLEIGLGEGYTTDRILSEFNSTVMRFTPEDPAISPMPNSVNIMTIDPYNPADHVYGDGIMQGTEIPITVMDKLSGRYTGAEFCSLGTNTKFNIVFIDTSHRIEDTMYILTKIEQYIEKDDDYVIINGVYPPIEAAQGENREGSVWCGNDWMLLYFLSDLINQGQDVQFLSCDIDGGLVIMNKAALSKVVKIISTQYGDINQLLSYMHEEYTYEKFLECLNDKEEYLCRTSEIIFVDRLGLSNYFFN
jgi:hypothetical protein